MFWRCSVARTTIEKREYRDFSRGIHSAGKVVKAQFELTYRCNLHCVHCYTDPYNSREFFPKELETSQVKRIVDELAEYGVFWLNFTGGEVFARKDFFEIYDYAFKKGFALVLYTNGTCFTADIIAKLKARPPFFIDVSCHSVDEPAFDRFTQVPGSFKRFMAGIELVKASGLPYRLKTKAMNWNKTEIPAIRKFVGGLGIEFGFTTGLAPRLNGDASSLEHRLSAEDVRRLEDQQGVWNEDEESCRMANARLVDPPKSLYRCGCGSDSVHISAWGELGTCTHEYEARASLRELSLRDAVEKVFNQVRALRFESDSACGTCRIFSFCERTPTMLRLEAGDREAASAYNCDVALDRAERVTKTKLEHPLKKGREHEPEETLHAA